MFCFVDYRTSCHEKEILSSLNLDIIEIPRYPNLYKAIDGHVDIQVHILDKSQKKILINRDMDIKFKNTLNNLNISYIDSKSFLKTNYPNNICLNALNISNYFIHNLKYTDENLLFYNKDKNLINVKQGYTKCSCLPVSDKALITNDIGIYKTLLKYNFDILLLPPGDIVLEGLDYGFIGGTGGLITPDIMAFFGNLDFYKYGEEVKIFLSKYDVKPVYLKNTKLIDRGSLFVL